MPEVLPSRCRILFPFGGFEVLEFIDAVLICLTAFLAAGVTLFSGFGLGTLLMPVFVLFIPIETAIALTAVVHLFNNLLKLILLGRYV
jgi:uncharacterized protein